MEYQDQFKAYEGKRARYAERQEELRDFLAKFTGEPSAQEPEIVFRDLATLEGLRLTRDIAFAEYAIAEAAIIKNLLARILK